FFSSRRRHTRSYGDWSSDVCSSDLAALAAAVGVFPERSIARARSEPFTSATHATVIRFPTAAMLAYPRYQSTRSSSVVRPIAIRSEERRVGKECRSRGWPEQRKENR